LRTTATTKSRQLVIADSGGRRKEKGQAKQRSIIFYICINITLSAFSSAGHGKEVGVDYESVHALQQTSRTLDWTAFFGRSLANENGNSPARKELEHDKGKQSIAKASRWMRTRVLNCPKKIQTAT